MGTLKGKVQRLATVGLDRSSTIQSMSFFIRMAMLLGKGLNGCQSWMMVALGRTPCIRSVVRYSWCTAVWSRRTGRWLVEEVDKGDWMSPPRPSADRRLLRSSALKRTSRIPWREESQGLGLQRTTRVKHRLNVGFTTFYMKQYQQSVISTHKYKECAFVACFLPAWLWYDTSGNPWVQADHHGSSGLLWPLGTWIWPAQSKSAAELLPRPCPFPGGQHGALPPAWSLHRQSHTLTPEQSAEHHGGRRTKKIITLT